MTSSVSAHSLIFSPTPVISAHCFLDTLSKSAVVMVTTREKVVLLVSVVTRRGEDAVRACVEPPAARRVHLCKCVLALGFLLLMEHLALHR